MTDLDRARINQEINNQVADVVRDIKKGLCDKIKYAKTTKDIKDAILAWGDTRTYTVDYMKHFV